MNLVSADIGCGLALVPVVDKRGRHLTRSADAAEALEFHSHVLACMRRSLKRGKVQRPPSPPGKSEAGRLTDGSE